MIPEWNVFVWQGIMTEITVKENEPTHFAYWKYFKIKNEMEVRHCEVLSAVGIEFSVIYLALKLIC